MIAKTTDMNEVTTGQSWVVGKAKTSKGMFRANERVMLFEGVTTALDYIDQNLPTAKCDKSSLESSGHAGNSFKSYKEAMDTFRNKPESVVKYDPTELHAAEYGEQGNDLEYDVTGDFIDVGRVLEGVPEQFGSLHNGNPRNRRIRIVVGLSQGARTTPQSINHRSERIIRLVDALENTNVRTEILAIDSNGCSHTEIIVKRFDESLVIEDVAVATNVDFFRRMLFRASEWSDTWQDGYGSSKIISRNLKELKSELNDEVTIYVDGNLESPSGFFGSYGSNKTIDQLFEELETIIEKELQEEVPTINLIELNKEEVKVTKL